MTNCGLVVIRIALIIMLNLACLPLEISYAQDSKGASAAYHFILDYDVPESPAFAILGVTPEKVLRGSAAKPLTISLLNQIGASREVQSGIAVEFSPYFTFGGRLKNIKEYRQKDEKRIAANTLLSLATVLDNADTTSLLFGIAVRTTLFDSHDLLFNPSLGEEIDKALMETAEAGSEISGDGVGEPIIVPGLADAYDKAKRETARKVLYESVKEKVRKTTGHALSWAYGFTGQLHHSIANFDSVENISHRTWLAYRYSLGTGYDFLGMYKASFASSSLPDHRLGIAVRKLGAQTTLTAEVVYSSITSRIEGGINMSVKLFHRVSLVYSLATQAEDTGQVSLTKITLKTNLRWNLSEE